VLLGAAMAIAERVTPSQDGGLDVEIPFSALDMLSSTAQDRVFYRVDGPQGMLTGYAELAPLPGPGQGQVFADARVLGADVRAVTLRRSLTSAAGNLTVTVSVAETTLARGALAQSILVRSGLRMGLMALAAAVISWAVVTLALRPLNRLGRAIAARPPQDLTPLSAPVPPEIAPLIGAMNGFIGRLARAMGALRRFTANANHQIRTPLATARTHLALAARGGPGAASSLAKADAALIRAERVLAQLLLLSRVEAAGALPLTPVDLAALAREIAAEALPRADAAGQDLGYDGPDSLPVRTEPVLLAEALRNLLDNALTHAGPGAEITVTVRPRGAFAVTDTGPGLPPDRLAALFDDAAPAPPGAEHGLGIAIVRDIASRLGARLTASGGPQGRGLTVRLDLSPVPGPQP
jgi:two-component system sensor histidine kinase TctE